MPRKPSKRNKIEEPERGLVPDRLHGAQDKVYNAYLESLDPENVPEIQMALAQSPDQRFLYFLEHLGKPGPFGKNSRRSMAAIAKHAGISLREFNDWTAKQVVQIAIAKIQLASVNRVQQEIEAANTTMEYCERCDGLGFVSADAGLPEDTPGYRVLRFDTTPGDADAPGEKRPIWIRTCPACKGARERPKLGDEFAREKMMEAAGLINKKGPMVAITNNLGGASLASAVPRLSSAMTIDVDAHESNG